MRIVRWLPLALIGLVAGMLAAPQAEARSLYCGSNLVRIGDPIWRVGRRCPDPFWVERWQQPLAWDRFGRPFGYHTDTIEIWYLNFGQRRLMRRLTFRNGHLEREQSLGYGVNFTPGTRRCSARELQIAGDTIGEIYARCGEPDYRYDFSTAVGPYYGGPWPLPVGTERILWAYDYGGGRFVRELFFINGRLIHARAQDR